MMTRNQQHQAAQRSRFVKLNWASGYLQQQTRWKIPDPRISYWTVGFLNIYKLNSIRQNSGQEWPFRTTCRIFHIKISFTQSLITSNYRVRAANSRLPCRNFIPNRATICFLWVSQTKFSSQMAWMRFKASPKCNKKVPTKPGNCTADDSLG